MKLETIIMHILNKYDTPSNTFQENIMVGLWCLMPLSAIFQFISWQSVLLVEETGVPGENHRPVASH